MEILVNADDYGLTRGITDRNRSRTAERGRAKCRCGTERRALPGAS